MARLDKIFLIRVNDRATQGAVVDNTPNILNLPSYGTYPNGIIAQLIEAVFMNLTETDYYIDIVFPQKNEVNNEGTIIDSREIIPFSYNTGPTGTGYFTCSYMPAIPKSVKFPGFTSSSLLITLRRSNGTVWTVNDNDECFFKVRLIGY